jgi:hypothetical protein
MASAAKVSDEVLPLFRALGGETRLLQRLRGGDRCV